MNNFKLRVKLDQQKKPVGPHKVRMKLSAYADQAGAFGEILKAAFEVEIMGGTSHKLRDGSAVYCFELDDEKAAQLRQALTMAFFNPEAN